MSMSYLLKERNTHMTNNNNVHYDTYRPPVSTSVVPSSDDYLGSHVLDRAAECVRRVLIEDRLLAQAKIRDFDISSLVQQYILRLQISVHDA